VVGNCNEAGLCIGETTYGGAENLQHQAGAIMDYGSLIWVTLQRASTAREAITTAGELMAQYGYASQGESFSIVDQTEAWVMEIIGKGDYEKGAVWVAAKVPEGYVCAHANQARITTFDLNDSDNYMFASDVVTFAQSVGLYSESGSAAAFSFSDVYDAVTFSGARFCEARVWSFFGDIMGEDWANQYLDYAQGYNITNRMPLFVQPASKLSTQDVMEHMRNHYENTQLDMTGTEFNDVGAGFSVNPFRTHGLTWSANVDYTDGSTTQEPVDYLHERPIATPQTGWNFVASSRSWMPKELAAVLWFGVDDSSTTVHFPIYGSATRMPEKFYGQGPQDGVVPPMMSFSFDSAFYVFNMVANFAYSRWDLVYSGDIYDKIVGMENAFAAEIASLDKVASALYTAEGAAAAVELTTAYSVKAGNQLVTDWLAYFGELFVKYRDGYVITANEASTSCGCATANAGYPTAWYDRIARDTGGHYFYGNPETGELGSEIVADKQVLKGGRTRKFVSKLDLLNRR
jgi:dipeptidase